MILFQMLLMLRNGRFGAMRTLGTVTAYGHGRFPNKRNDDDEVHGHTHDDRRLTWTVPDFRARRTVPGARRSRKRR